MEAIERSAGGTTVASDWYTPGGACKAHSDTNEVDHESEEVYQLCSMNLAVQSEIEVKRKQGKYSHSNDMRVYVDCVGLAATSKPKVTTISLVSLCHWSALFKERSRDPDICLSYQQLNTCRCHVSHL